MNKIIKPLAKNKSILFLAFISFVITLITMSCDEDPSSIGSGILPDSDKLKTLYDTTFTFKNQVFKKEPFVTSNISHHSLGVIDDPYFGELKGQMASEFFYSVDDPDIIYYPIDSLMLYLSIDSTYGSPESVTFNIYELNTTIESDSSHYSNEDVDFRYSEAGILNISSEIRGDTLLVFRLKDSFAQRLKSDTLFYDSDDNFREEFKGIAIIPSKNNSSEPGGTYLINFSTTYTKIALNYDNGNDTTIGAVNYYFSRGNRYTQYAYDYSSSVANNYLTNPEDENDDLILIQGVDGVSSKLELTDLDEWLNKNATYSILKAELTNSVLSDPDIETFYPPEQLSLHYTDTDGEVAFLEDYTSTGMFDGSYNDSTEKYNFNISKHFSDLVNHKIDDLFLNYDVVNSYTSPHRVIIDAGEEIKLRVTYTKHE